MPIEPYILLPSAAMAVLLLIGFIRLMTGRRDMQLEDATVRAFLQNEEPGASVHSVRISDDGRVALAWVEDAAPTRLLRSFGNKIVMQTIGAGDLEITALPDRLDVSVRAQGLSHPAVRFSLDADKTENRWLQAMRHGNGGAA